MTNSLVVQRRCARGRRDSRSSVRGCASPTVTAPRPAASAGCPPIPTAPAAATAARARRAWAGPAARRVARAATEAAPAALARRAGAGTGGGAGTTGGGAGTGGITGTAGAGGTGAHTPRGHARTRNGARPLLWQRHLQRRAHLSFRCLRRGAQERRRLRLRIRMAQRKRVPALGVGSDRRGPVARAAESTLSDRDWSAGAGVAAGPLHLDLSLVSAAPDQNTGRRFGKVSCALSARRAARLGAPRSRAVVAGVCVMRSSRRLGRSLVAHSLGCALVAHAARAGLRWSRALFEPRCWSRRRRRFPATRRPRRATSRRCCSRACPSRRP